MKKSYSRMILLSILVSVLILSITACASDAAQIHEDVVDVADNVPSVTSEQSEQSEQSGQPVQSEQIEESQSVSSDDEESEYVFRCVDENGDPVTGVTLQICTDETCALVKTDETGVVKYAEKPYEYDVHVYRYDEGYELISDAEFKTDDVYGAYDIKFVKK